MNDGFELPLNGATGYAPVEMIMHKEAAENSTGVLTLKPGMGFRILAEDGQWWKVQRNNHQGYVDNRRVFINLPDVIPSIVYNLTNAYQSRFVSLGKDIPGITGHKLFENRTFNQRLGKTEFIAPILYPMAKKIQSIQRRVWAAGQTLKIYEAFRPYPVQQQVCQKLSDLAQHDPAIKAGISTPPWELEWFIADDISNHQIGYAMDVTLAKVNATQSLRVGSYQVETVSEETEYQMYTPIHELSERSALFTQPVWTGDRLAWRKSKIREVVDENAMRLHNYCTAGGLTPLASEWWHFNDLDAYDEIADDPSNGNYIIHELYSQFPNNSNAGLR